MYNQVCVQCAADSASAVLIPYPARKAKKVKGNGAALRMPVSLLAPKKASSVQTTPIKEMRALSWPKSLCSLAKLITKSLIPGGAKHNLAKRMRHTRVQNRGSFLDAPVFRMRESKRSTSQDTREILRLVTTKGETVFCFLL
jgi:hypothetical protein